MITVSKALDEVSSPAPWVSMSRSLPTTPMAPSVAVSVMLLPLTSTPPSPLASRIDAIARSVTSPPVEKTCSTFMLPSVSSSQMLPVALATMVPAPTASISRKSPASPTVPPSARRSMCAARIFVKSGSSPLFRPSTIEPAEVRKTPPVCEKTVPTAMSPTRS